MRIYLSRFIIIFLFIPFFIARLTERTCARTRATTRAGNNDDGNLLYRKSAYRSARLNFSQRGNAERVDLSRSLFSALYRVYSSKPRYR